MSLLKLEGVSRRFGGVKAVSGVSFTVEPGELYGVIGPNGAGKTTLFNLITGLIRPDAGSVVLDGVETTRKSPEQIAQLGIARTYQTIRLFDTMTVRENVMVGGHIGLSYNLLDVLAARGRYRRSERALRERVELSAGGRSLLQGRGGAELNTQETEGQMLQRVMPDLMGLKNIMVLNDEAHHCYREKPGEIAEGDLAGDEKKEAEKNNKDKKAVKAAIEAAGKDVNIPLAHHGPDWNGFLKGVQNSDLKDKDKILNVVNSVADPKKKEQEIRNMILIYPQIEEKLLPPLRRCEVTANLYEPRFTDEELSKYAVSDPSKLKVEELLYAATITNDPAAKLTIYDNAAKQFPNNWKALNNAAAANIVKGNYAKANDYLTKAQGVAPNNGIIENNLGVVAAMQNNSKKAEAQFKKAQQLGENENYNLGIYEIPRGNYPKALNMLGNTKCNYNLGLAQLVSGNNSAAEATLKCAPQTPGNSYLLAIVGARTNNTKMLYEYLMKACQDANLKVQAQGDREFYNFAKTPEFQNIVK